VFVVDGGQQVERLLVLLVQVGENLVAILDGFFVTIQHVLKVGTSPQGLQVEEQILFGLDVWVFSLHQCFHTGIVLQGGLKVAQVVVVPGGLEVAQILQDFDVFGCLLESREEVDAGVVSFVHDELRVRQFVVLVRYFLLLVQLLVV